MRNTAITSCGLIDALGGACVTRPPIVVVWEIEWLLREELLLGIACVTRTSMVFVIAVCCSRLRMRDMAIDGCGLGDRVALARRVAAWHRMRVTAIGGCGLVVRDWEFDPCNAEIAKDY